MAGLPLFRFPHGASGKRRYAAAPCPPPTAFAPSSPVLARLAYLNAGHEGPIAARAASAARAAIDAELADGRAHRAWVEAIEASASGLRERLAALLGCDAAEVALTGSTTDGVNLVLAALDLRAGDEVVTSDEEHPGVLGPLGLAARRRGVRVRVAPFAALHEAVGPHTRLVACSHVAWVSGRMLDHAALRATAAPVLLDGAQGLGAVPVDVRELGCDWYAAPAQKWLCGPDALGCLYGRAELVADLPPARPGYVSLADPERALELAPRAGAARLDTGRASGPGLAWAHAALDVLEEAGWGLVHDRGRALAARLAARLAELGAAVAPRGDSTLVAWADADAPARAERLAAAGFVVRAIPGRGLVRASVGAWSSEEELERLALAAVAP